MWLEKVFPESKITPRYALVSSVLKTTRPDKTLNSNKSNTCKSIPDALTLYDLMCKASAFKYLFIWVLRHFQHCTGHITMGSWKNRGNQYIQLVKALYCKLLTNGKQLPAFPLEAVPGTKPRPQRWEARVFPLCHRGPNAFKYVSDISLQVQLASHYLECALSSCCW